MPSSRRSDAGDARRGRRAHRRRSLSGLFALALALVFLADAAYGAAEEGAPAPAPGARESGTIRPLEPGALAPDFTVRDTAGQMFHFDAERGKSPCLLVFWSIFCEPCRLQMTPVQALYLKFRDAGLRVAALSLDGQPLEKVVAGFAKQEGYAFPMLLDELDDRGAFKVADPYGVSGMPSTFLVGRDGRIAARWVGFAKGEELEKAVQSSLRP